MSNIYYKRVIDIVTENSGKKADILHELSVQLSDGYWENEENFFGEYWNWLEFGIKNNVLKIMVKKYPTWNDTPDIFPIKQTMRLFIMLVQHWTLHIVVLLRYLQSGETQ